MHQSQGVIILIEGACLAREREESNAILPNRSGQRHIVTSLETARSLANGPSWGGGGGLFRASKFATVKIECSFEMGK